jgi:hypothetical protein
MKPHKMNPKPEQNEKYLLFGHFIATFPIIKQVAPIANTRGKKPCHCAGLFYAPYKALYPFLAAFKGLF